MAALDVEKEAGMFHYLTHSRTKVHTVRFIPQREWFVAGDSYGYIHVYTCLGMKEIKRFKAHGGSPVKALEVHRTYPYLLSACEDGAIRVWNWDKHWTCSREVCLFSENSTRGWVIVKFNPKDTDTFTSHDQYGGLKVKSSLSLITCATSSVLYCKATRSVHVLGQSDFDLHYFKTILTGLVDLYFR